MIRETSIVEGGIGRRFRPVSLLRINNKSGGTSLWVPAEEVEMDSIEVTENGLYLAANDDLYAYNSVSVNVTPEADRIYSKNKKYTVDDNGNIKEESMPSGIKIIKPPTKTVYQDGDEIDYSGIEVCLLDENGAVYKDENYPDGIIPFEELIFPIEIYDVDKFQNDSETPVNYVASSDIAEDVPVYQSCLGNVSGYGNLYGSLYGNMENYFQIRPNYGMIIYNIYAAEQAGTEYYDCIWVWYAMFAPYTDREVLKEWVDFGKIKTVYEDEQPLRKQYTKAIEAPDQDLDHPFGGIYTHDGKSVAFYVGVDSFGSIILKDFSASSIPVLDTQWKSDLFYREKFIMDFFYFVPQHCWTALYGERKYEIPVQWEREDEKVFEDSFIINGVSKNN